MTEPDWSSLAEPVARHLWGEPNKALSHKLELRWGGGGSRKLNIGGESNGFWHDFESGEGGGAIDLVMRETSTDKAGALDWLAQNGFIEGKEPRAASQPRQDGRSPAPAPEVPPDQERQPELPVETPQGVPVNVKGYRYTDGDGNVLYEVIRQQFKLPDGSWQLGKSGNPKKTFWQRRPDGKGGHIAGLGDVKHTLYHRPQLEIGIAEGKIILVPEGEKDVETIEAWGMVATTNSGGAQNWRTEFAEFFRGADVVILGDDDEAGRKRVETVAMSLRGIAGRIRAIGSWGGPKDVTDWKEAGHTASELVEILNTLPDWRPAPPKSCFNAMTIDEAVRVGRRAHSWLVQDLIELLGTCSFAGFTQSGKSFAMIKLGFCIALGQQFFGHDVMQGLVVYQVGEGATGFMKRVEGYCQDAGIEDRSEIPLVILPSKINLFVDDKDTDALIQECKNWEAYWKARSGQKLRVLIIDTLNKATRGANEISGQDMGKINDRVERIARELACTVIVVDHLSAQGRLRGHTSKTDDMANTVKVEVTGKEDNNGRKIRRMVFEKVKDGENGVSIPFVLRSINIGLDDMGHPVTTCVVDSPDGEIADELSKGAVSVGPALLLRIIKDTAEIMGTAAPPELVQVPPGRNVAKWDDVKAMVRKQWSLTATDSKAVDLEVKRIVGQYGNRLKLAGYIDRDNDRGLIWWTGKEQKPRQPQGAKPIEKAKPSPLMTDDDLSVPF